MYTDKLLGTDHLKSRIPEVDKPCWASSQKLTLIQVTSFTIACMLDNTWLQGRLAEHKLELLRDKALNFAEIEGCNALNNKNL